MNRVNVKTKEIRFPTAPDLYGLFFEDINRSGDGGLYPEMLRNRSFEDSLLPERCQLLPNGLDFITPTGWKDQFNNGEGLRRWDPDRKETPVPAWYVENGTMELDFAHVLNSKRKAALHVSLQENGILYNIGYRGIACEAQNSYEGYLFLRTDCPLSLKIALVNQSRTVCYAEASLSAAADDSYHRVDFSLTSRETDPNAVLLLSSEKSCSFFLGYSSLMPTETYKNHGLRKDLVQLLEGTHSRFFRFPGGCIVEGFTKETTMRFSNTIGPVWERPSHNLMWHYRTSNGLGFHEYLQLCEDLSLEPLYVINCGLTCQGRREELFTGEELEEFLQEACDAIDYATAPSHTPMGSKRAAAGHPDPFKMTYVEIGNENLGPEYLWRYRMFYDTLKERYPQIQFIANVHVEQDGHPTDIVDEHYYNTPEFFARQYHMFDAYDRQGPKIFVGEYAVTNGDDVGNLRSAIAESMYLMGIENNQDIVKLTAYAPLFNHVHYTSWSPDLIAYDNHQSYGIPFYHALSMLADNRGDQVVALSTESDVDYENTRGLTAFLTNGEGVKIRNIFCNGKAVTPSHNIVADLRKEEGAYCSWKADNIELMKTPGLSVREVLSEIHTYVTFGEEETVDTILEAEIFLPDASAKTSLSFWNHNNTMLHNQDETRCGESKLWTPVYTNRYVWSLEKGYGYVDAITRGRYSWRGPHKKLLQLRYGEWMKLRVEAAHERIRCFIDDELVMDQPNVSYPTTAAVATVTQDQLLLKLANMKPASSPVTIQLDCEPASEYDVVLLTGKDPKLENSFEQPLAVSPVNLSCKGAAREFIYQAPPFSLSILKLRIH